MVRTKQQISRPHIRTSAEIDQAISELNARIHKLSETTLPKQPYLLSVPSDVPYRHSSRFVQTWYVGTPFKRSEEQLQYLSYLPHNGDYEELLVAEGEWADDRGSWVDNRQRTQALQSTPGTPLSQPGRKKISLQDYKKEKVEAGSNPVKSVEVKAETLPVVVKAEKIETMPRSSRSPERGVKHERGRSPVRAEARKAPVPMPQVDGTISPMRKSDLDSSRPLKKRKLSDSSPAKTSGDKSQPPKMMPKLLSPTLPSSPERKQEMPELLSPLLPPSLMKALATPPSSSSSETNTGHRRTDSVRSILGTINEDGPRSAEKGSLTVPSATGSRMRSDSQNSARSATSASGKVLSRPGVKSSVGTPTANRSPGPRQRHIIVLKYGKKNRKRVESLLRFKSRPKPVLPPAVTAEPSKSEAPKQALPKEPHKAAIERGTSPDRPTSKARPMREEALKRPSTPLMNGINKDNRSAASPAVKAVSATPKKEFKSTAMRRVESVEGMADPATPGSKPRASTPASVERSRALKTSPLPSSSLQHEAIDDRHAWLKLSDDRGYFALSRKLKHEGSTLANQASGTADMHKALLLLVEALLGFILNTAIQGHARPRHDPGWSTILGYYNFVFTRTRSCPHLHGLVIQLGAVCRQAIQKHSMERLAREPLPESDSMHNGAAPTPGSDGNTRTSGGAEDSEGNRKKYLAFKDELIQNTEELNTSWLKGSRLLSIELLQKEYPETWRARLRDFENRGKEKIVPGGGNASGTLAKGYYLPIDPATTAFEAVEYALKVMGEWADREIVDWRARLQL